MVSLDRYSSSPTYQPCHAQQLISLLGKIQLFIWLLPLMSLNNCLVADDWAVLEGLSDSLADLIKRCACLWCAALSLVCSISGAVSCVTGLELCAAPVSARPPHVSHFTYLSCTLAIVCCLNCTGAVLFTWCALSLVQ